MQNEHHDLWHRVAISSDPDWGLLSTQWAYDVIQRAGIDETDERLKFDIRLHGVHPVTYMGMWIYVPYSRESIGCLVTTEHYEALVRDHGAAYVTHCGWLYHGLAWVLVDGSRISLESIQDGIAAAVTMLRNAQDGSAPRIAADDATSAESLILLWNPAKWSWPLLEQHIHRIASDSHCVETWKIASHQRVRLGMRCFVLRTGHDPRGIMASGVVVSPPHETEAYDDPEMTQLSIAVRFDIMLHPQHDALLLTEHLARLPALSEVFGTPIRRSGDVLSEEHSRLLLQRWQQHLDTIRGDVSFEALPEEELETFYSEGAVRQLSINAYERSGNARDAAIRIHGTTCAVCAMRFADVYGPIGNGFIHVHHKRPISQIGSTYEINPETDLVAVCPNCHAMLHRRTPPYTVEELRRMMG